jgi:hypothetical protein
MRIAHRITASAIRATSFIAFSAVFSIGAMAASEGSTDIYASNGIAASFGAPTTQSASPLAAANYSGSTDTWGVNGFRASFGPGVPVAQPTNVCRTGSTDIYGVNGFLVSFKASPIQAAGDLARPCQGAATVLKAASVIAPGGEHE